MGEPLERNLVVPFTVRCGALVCAFRNRRTGRLALCEHYSHRSRQYGRCTLTGEGLSVRTVIDGIPIAKRSWKCLEGEHLWEKIQSPETDHDIVST